MYHYDFSSIYKIDSYCTCAVQRSLLYAYLMSIGLFLAFDGASTRTDPFTSGKKYRKLVNNAVFIRKLILCFSIDNRATNRDWKQR